MQRIALQNSDLAKTEVLPSRPVRICLLQGDATSSTLSSTSLTLDEHANTEHRCDQRPGVCDRMAYSIENPIRPGQGNGH
jgi:hypothetical protein